jgi:hypothetical protein
MLLITLLDDNEAKPPIIVAYLRQPHICNNMFHVIMLFYISLHSWSNIELCTVVDRKRLRYYVKFGLLKSYLEGQTKNLISALFPTGYRTSKIQVRCVTAMPTGWQPMRLISEGTEPGPSTCQADAASSSARVLCLRIVPVTQWKLCNRRRNSSVVI